MSFWLILVTLTTSLTVTGDLSWYDPPAAYNLPWSDLLATRAAWGQLHGLAYDPTQPYCAARDFPLGAYIELRWEDKVTRCYVIDYGPDPTVFPERAIDASREVFARLATPSTGVLHDVTATLLDVAHVGPAPEENWYLAGPSGTGRNFRPQAVPW